MIPHYQKDGSCAVKSVNEYLQMHTFKDDEDYNEEERKITVEEVKELIEDNMVMARQRIEFHSVNDLIAHFKKNKRTTIPGLRRPGGQLSLLGILQTHTLKNNEELKKFKIKLSILQKQIDKKIHNQEICIDKMRDPELIDFGVTIIEKLHEPMHSFQATSREQR